MKLGGGESSAPHCEKFTLLLPMGGAPGGTFPEGGWLAVYPTEGWLEAPYPTPGPGGGGAGPP